MSYTGLNKSQSTRFTNDIGMFIEFAIENTANDLNVVDSEKHLKALASKFVEDYSKSVPKKRTSTKKALTEEEKEERALLKAVTDSEKKAKKDAETKEKKKLREEKAIKKAKEKEDWISAQRITDPDDNGKELQGEKGVFLRVQKHRILGTFRKKIGRGIWTEKANEVFKTHYSMISNVPKTKKPDMSKILQKLNVEDETYEESKVIENSNQIEEDIVSSKAALLEKKAARNLKKALKKQKKEAVLKKQEEAEEAALKKQEEAEEAALKKQEEAEEAALKKQKEAEEAALKKQEEEMMVEDIELDEDLMDSSDDDDDDEYEDFEHENWPNKNLKIDKDGGIWDVDTDDLLAMKREDGTITEA